MSRKAGHRSLVVKTKRQRQRIGRKKESRKTKEANALARRKGF